MLWHSGCKAFRITSVRRSFSTAYTTALLVSDGDRASLVVASWRSGVRYCWVRFLGMHPQYSPDGWINWASNRVLSIYVVTLFLQSVRRSPRSRFLILERILELLILLWIWQLSHRGGTWLWIPISILSLFVLEVVRHTPTFGSSRGSAILLL